MKRDTSPDGIARGIARRYIRAGYHDELAPLIALAIRRNNAAIVRTLKKQQRPNPMPDEVSDEAWEGFTAGVTWACDVVRARNRRGR